DTAQSGLFQDRNAPRLAFLALSRWSIPEKRPSSALVHARPLRMIRYAELAVTTNYSFLHGASHPGQFVEQANALSYAAIGIADRNSLAGVVRAYDAGQRLKPGTPPRLLIGARLVFQDGTPDILVYPQDRTAYGRLCQLLSLGKSRAPKGECFLTLQD